MITRIKRKIDKYRNRKKKGVVLEVQSMKHKQSGGFYNG